MRYEINFSKEVKKFIAKHEEVSFRFFTAIEKIATGESQFLDIRRLQ
jgi:hypothetical protein